MTKDSHDMENVRNEPSAACVTEAENRVYTNDLDALEALILAGLPPDEMQSAAWVLVQRVRGLRADLMHLQRSIVEARSG